MIGVELALVMLAAPAATAGAICLDRARGTLAHMLMTDLSDPEIVLGKLAARLLPVLGLVACTWPVMAISSLLGRDRPDRADAGVRHHRGRGRARLHDGPGAVGLGQEVARSDPGDVYRLHPGPASLADLVFLVDGRAGSARRRRGPFWPTRSMWRSPRTPIPGKLDFWDYLVFFGVALGPPPC